MHPVCLVLVPQRDAGCEADEGPNLQPWHYPGFLALQANVRWSFSHVEPSR